MQKWKPLHPSAARDGCSDRYGKKLIKRERESEEKQTSVANKKIPESSWENSSIVEDQVIRKRRMIMGKRLNLWG